MMTELSRDTLDQDASALIFEARRGTVRIHGQRVSHLLNRCGVELRQWDHLQKCWMASIRYMPALLAQADRDRRNVLIESDDE
jgi:hypothetical protein